MQKATWAGNAIFWRSIKGELLAIKQEGSVLAINREGALLAINQEGSLLAINQGRAVGDLSLEKERCWRSMSSVICHHGSTLLIIHWLLVIEARC